MKINKEELINNLDKKLEGRILVYDNEQISGQYLFKDYSPNREADYLFREGLQFDIDITLNELKIIISDYPTFSSSLGKKLAALSDFYNVLSKFYKNPLAFYTFEDDGMENLCLFWSFENKEDDIKALKEAESLKNLIIFENKQELRYGLNKRTKESISRVIGLPFELINLIKLPLGKIHVL